ncbi:MAG: recombinase RecA, partial [Endomicrobia bacterium]|nr:recombinase RecA [Endomicrobiia bacterium]
NDNIIEKAGAFFSYNGDRLGQGRDNVKAFLLANPAIASEIENKIRAKAFGETAAEKKEEPAKEKTVKKSK